MPAHRPARSGRTTRVGAGFPVASRRGRPAGPRPSRPSGRAGRAGSAAGDGRGRRSRGPRPPHARRAASISAAARSSGASRADAATPRAGETSAGSSSQTIWASPCPGPSSSSSTAPRTGSVNSIGPSSTQMLRDRRQAPLGSGAPSGSHRLREGAARQNEDSLTANGAAEGLVAFGPVAADPVAPRACHVEDAGPSPEARSPVLARTSSPRPGTSRDHLTPAARTRPSRPTPRSTTVVPLHDQAMTGVEIIRSPGAGVNLRISGVSLTPLIAIPFFLEQVRSCRLPDGDRTRPPDNEHRTTANRTDQGSDRVSSALKASIARSDNSAHSFGRRSMLAARPRLSALRLFLPICRLWST